MNRFIERHQVKITAVLSCFDRIVITVILSGIGHAEGMARYLSGREFRLFDYPRWAEPLREELRTHAERLATEASLEIESLRNYKVFRKGGSRRFWFRAGAPGASAYLLGDGGRPSYCPVMTSSSIRSAWSPPRQVSARLVLFHCHNLARSA